MLSTIFEWFTARNQAITNTPTTQEPSYTLSDDVLLIILPYCREDLQIYLMFTNKVLYEAYKKLGADLPSSYPLRNYLNLTNPEQRLLDKQKIFATHPQEFIDQLGGYKQITKIPIMDIGDQMGFTGSLDFKVSLPVFAPVVRGFDIYNRAFYFATASMKDEDRVLTFKFFQRYTNQKLVWVSASNHDDNPVNDEILRADDILNYLAQYRDAVTDWYSWFNLSMDKYEPQERSSLAHKFFAQLITTGEVSHPHIIVMDDTRIPAKHDEDYRPIKLGL